MMALLDGEESWVGGVYSPKDRDGGAYSSSSVARFRLTNYITFVRIVIVSLRLMLSLGTGLGNTQVAIS